MKKTVKIAFIALVCLGVSIPSFATTNVVTTPNPAESTEVDASAPITEQDKKAAVKRRKTFAKMAAKDALPSTGRISVDNFASLSRESLTESLALAPLLDALYERSLLADVTLTPAETEEVTTRSVNLSINIAKLADLYKDATVYVNTSSDVKARFECNASMTVSTAMLTALALESTYQAKQVKAILGK